MGCAIFLVIVSLLSVLLRSSLFQQYKAQLSRKPLWMKKAKQTPASASASVLSLLLTEDDILESVLSFVDLASLGPCSAVCKSWNSILKTPSFRRRWCHNSGDKEAIRILNGSFSIHHRCRAWDPSPQANHQELVLPYHSQPFPLTGVVASAGGLVCILRCDPKGFNPKSDEFHLVVTNPVTREWTELPPLHWKDREVVGFMGVLDVTMSLHNEEDFKVALYYTTPESSGHWCCIFDSATRSWSFLPKRPFSPSYVQAAKQRLAAYDPPPAAFPELDGYFYDLGILGFYDIGRAKWRSDEAVVRSLRITTGLEGEENLRCVLARPGTCSTRLWEHNGQRYFASGWVYAGGKNEFGDNGVDGFGVWEVDDNGVLVTVTAVLDDVIRKELFPGDNIFRECFRCETAAEGDLVVFSQAQFLYFYFLSTGRWGGVCGGLFEIEDKVVLYRPSVKRVRTLCKTMN